jgi:hypothetical protein
MEDILENGGIEARSLTWLSLAAEAGIYGVSDRTIRRHMHTLEYKKCLACVKSWISPRICEIRVTWVKEMLIYRPR